MRPRHSALLAIQLLAACGGTDAPAPVGGGTGPASERARYSNPVLDRDFPDPAVHRAADGWIYAYATQTSGVNVQAARSRDLVSWDFLGEVMPEKPSWAKTTQDFWAPHLQVADGKTLLYFSARPDQGDGMCIGVATGAGPAGPFADSGKPILCGKGIEVIDPMAFDDPASGKRLLYWGSGGAPIFVQELDQARTAFAPGSKPIELLRATPGKPFETLLEGPWVHRRGDWYYLFTSGDDCCGNGNPRRPAHYAMMVARSRSATGPFTTMSQETGASSNVVLGDGKRWLAPGHNAIVTDDAGVDWVVYHAMDANNPLIEGTRFARRALLIDPIVWREDGWPEMAGGVASQGARPPPTFGSR